MPGKRTQKKNARGPVRMLHLSDLHFSAKHAWDSDAVLSGLVDAVREIMSEGLRPDVVAITGDVANYGKETEYDAARQWIDDDLRHALGSGAVRVPCLVVPGNHDVDRGAVKAVAQKTQDGLLSDPDQQTIADVLGDADERAVLLERHVAYLRFANALLPLKDDLDVPWWSLPLTVNGTKVHFVGRCSSFMSCGDQDRGRLLVGHWQAQTLLKGANTAVLRVVLIHHPWSYLAEWDEAEVETLVHRESDLLLRGHLHKR